VAEAVELENAIEDAAVELTHAEAGATGTAGEDESPVA
jgi:hypothetical protein